MTKKEFFKAVSYGEEDVIQIFLDEYVVMPNHFHCILQLISDKNERNSSLEHINGNK